MAEKIRHTKDKFVIGRQSNEYIVRREGDLWVASHSASLPNRSGAATHLVIVGMPATAVQDTVMDTFTVEARKIDENIDVNYTSNVTMSIFSGTGNLLGTATKPCVLGIATFDDLYIDTPGDFVLESTSGSLTTDTDTITISLNILSYNVQLWMNIAAGKITRSGNNVTAWRDSGPKNLFFQDMGTGFFYTWSGNESEGIFGSDDSDNKALQELNVAMLDNPTFTFFTSVKYVSASTIPSVNIFTTNHTNRRDIMTGAFPPTYRVLDNKYDTGIGKTNNVTRNMAAYFDITNGWTAGSTRDHWIGKTLVSHYNFRGYIQEILIIDGHLPAGDISTILTYLYGRWGGANHNLTSQIYYA